MLGAHPAVLLGAMMSGIFFGDALSPSSQVIHTTIASQHDAHTQKSADLIETMKERLPYILFAGIVSMILFYFLGSDTSAVEHVAELSKLSNHSGLWMLLPIVVLLLICFKTSDLFMGVSGGILTGIVIGLATVSYTHLDVYKRQKEAREEGFDDIADTMEGVLAIEKTHEQRYTALLNNIEDGTVFEKSEETVWECLNCGHLHTGKTAPEVCPVCNHPRSYFEVRNENY